MVAILLGRDSRVAWLGGVNVLMGSVGPVVGAHETYVGVFVSKESKHGEKTNNSLDLAFGVVCVFEVRVGG